MIKKIEQIEIILSRVSERFLSKLIFTNCDQTKSKYVILICTIYGLSSLLTLVQLVLQFIHNI